MQNKANLLDTQMNVTIVLTKYYENKRLYSHGENKPNQTQFKALKEMVKTSAVLSLSEHIVFCRCLFEGLSC